MAFKQLGKISKGDVNVVCVSMCFCILFSADIALTNIEKTLISSIEDDNEEFKLEGYNLLSTTYLTFGVVILFAPSVMSIIGVRPTMALGAAMQTFGFISYILEKRWFMYVTSFTAGFSAGLLWAALTKYLLDNSKPASVNRNIGLFWMVMCMSGVFGNSYTFIELRGQKYVNRHTRHVIIYGLMCTAGFATILFVMLRPSVNKINQQEKDITSEKTTALDELKTVWRMLKTKTMLILCITFAFVGLQQSFSFGTYGPAIGFTLEFGNKSKQLIPISGMLSSFGDAAGGFSQMLFGTKLSKLRWGRRIVVTTGVCMEIVAYALVYINLPPSAIYGNTEEHAIINSNVFLALLASFLFGIANGCFNTQIYAIIALFPEQGAHTTALYKFVKSTFVGGGFLFANHLNLHHLVGVYTLAAITGVIAFIYADIAAVSLLNKTRRDQNLKINT